MEVDAESPSGVSLAAALATHARVSEGRTLMAQAIEGRTLTAEVSGGRTPHDRIAE